MRIVGVSDDGEVDGVDVVVEEIKRAVPEWFMTSEASEASKD